MEFLQKAAKETKILIFDWIQARSVPPFSSVKSFVDLPYGNERACGGLAALATLRRQGKPPARCRGCSRAADPGYTLKGYFTDY